MSDESDLRLKCLLADFAAVKAEIARRSDLQRIAFAAYAGFLVFVLQKTIEQPHLIGPSRVLVWPAAFLTLLFQAREQSEIRRLSKILSEVIAESARRLRGTSDIHVLFPSETHRKHSPDAFWYDRILQWTAFLLAPLAWSVVPCLGTLADYPRDGMFWLGASIAWASGVLTLAILVREAGRASYREQASPHWKNDE